jgi:hypothetical protein
VNRELKKDYRLKSEKGAIFCPCIPNSQLKIQTMLEALKRFREIPTVKEIR